VPNAAKKTLQIALGLVASLGLVAFALSGVDLARVGDDLRGAEWRWVAAAFAASTYANWTRAGRWGVLFWHRKRIATASLFSSTMIGNAANTAIPIRVGEPLRAWSLARKEGLPFVMTFATVIVERLLDVAVLVLLLALTARWAPLPEGAGERLETALRILTGGVIVAVGALVVLFFRRDLLGRLADRGLAWLPSRLEDPARHALHAGLASLDALVDPRRLALLLAWSVWQWAWYAATFACTILALHLDAAYAVPVLPAAVAVTVVVAVFLMLPAAPGFVGTFQAGCILALGLYGVPKESALSFSLVAHAVQLVVVMGIGGFCAAREGIGWRQLGAHGEPSAREVEAALASSGEGDPTAPDGTRP
jgi:hypothetical protein